MRETDDYYVVEGEERECDGVMMGIYLNDRRDGSRKLFNKNETKRERGLGTATEWEAVRKVSLRFRFILYQ